MSSPPPEICFLSNNIHDYHIVAQGKTTIPSVDDGEEMQITDVRIGRCWTQCCLLSTVRSKYLHPRTNPRLSPLCPRHNSAQELTLHSNRYSEIHTFWSGPGRANDAQYSHQRLSNDHPRQDTHPGRQWRGRVWNVGRKSVISTAVPSSPTTPSTPHQRNHLVYHPCTDYTTILPDFSPITVYKVVSPKTCQTLSIPNGWERVISPRIGLSKCMNFGKIEPLMHEILASDTASWHRITKLTCTVSMVPATVFLVPNVCCQCYVLCSRVTCVSYIQLTCCNQTHQSKSTCSTKLTRKKDE